MFKLLEKLKSTTANHQYPLMRDPQFQPKCYELTDAERLAALARSDELLAKRVANQVPGYFGA
jgi:hypothetical protein